MKVLQDCFIDPCGGKRVKTQRSHFPIFEPNLSLQGAKSQMKKLHLVLRARLKPRKIKPLELLSLEEQLFSNL